MYYNKQCSPLQRTLEIKNVIGDSDLLALVVRALFATVSFTLDLALLDVLGSGAELARCSCCCCCV